MRSSTQFTSTAKLLKHTFSAACLGAGLLMAQVASATTVQFQTVMGDFEVNLFDKTTPKTVENFLAYVKADAYKNTIVHRLVPGFVVQGGGYRYNGKLPLISIPQNPKVINEPVYSNLRGTIAMAKLERQPDSATNQWFFNLANNAADLDNQNGGFTVFGQVTGNGMGILDSIAALNHFTLGALKGFPLRSYTDQDNKNNVAITDEHLVLIENIVILNADPDTASNLNPVKNNLVNEKEKDGGGAINIFFLFVLICCAFTRIFTRKD